jgi:hypothetical protein
MYLVMSEIKKAGGINICSIIIGLLIFIILTSGCTSSIPAKSSENQTISAETTAQAVTTTISLEKDVIKTSEPIPALPKLLYAKSEEPFEFVNDTSITARFGPNNEATGVDFYRIYAYLKEPKAIPPPYIAIVKLYDSEKNVIPIWIYAPVPYLSTEAVYTNEFDFRTQKWLSVYDVSETSSGFIIRRPVNQTPYYYSIEIRNLTSGSINIDDMKFVDAAETCYKDTPMITNISTHTVFVTCMQKTPHPTSVCALNYRSNALKYTKDDDTTAGNQRETYNVHLFRSAFFSNLTYNPIRLQFEPCK